VLLAHPTSKIAAHYHQLFESLLQHIIGQSVSCTNVAYTIGSAVQLAAIPPLLSTAAGITPQPTLDKLLIILHPAEVGDLS